MKNNILSVVVKIMEYSESGIPKLKEHKMFSSIKEGKQWGHERLSIGGNYATLQEGNIWWVRYPTDIYWKKV